ncbi:unnamed protein product [Caenorhabditis auriculariae]|uniref:Uncharacterized protein n=1 Tax=Caenorhabditis auriculariae TaxID=2777116 RepID=A0A8S1GU31_9PELO|nr:unnamed protein product [Caenorhabditis auriculariae]
MVRIFVTVLQRGLTNPYGVLKQPYQPNSTELFSAPSNVVSSHRSPFCLLTRRRNAVKAGDARVDNVRAPLPPVATVPGESPEEGVEVLPHSWSFSLTYPFVFCLVPVQMK